VQPCELWIDKRQHWAWYKWGFLSYLPKFDGFIICREKEKGTISDLAPSDFVDFLFYLQTLKVVKLKQWSHIINVDILKHRIFVQHCWKNDDYLRLVTLKLCFVTEFRVPAERIVHPLWIPSRFAMLHVSAYILIHTYYKFTILSIKREICQNISLVSFY
jgi:hypothetical protein